MAHPTPRAATRDLIVIGGSSGAIPVIETILRDLPADLPASILIVVHQPQGSPGLLPWLFARVGTLPVAHATDGDELHHGRVYIAPPDQHLLVAHNGRLRVTRGPKENRFRPAIDPLFRTAARAHGPRVIAVILSGMLDDGTLGLMQVNREGGVVIAQDPADADSPAMPASAIRNAHVDHVLKPNEIAGALDRLVREPMPAAPATAPHGVPAMSEKHDHDTLSGVGPHPLDVTERGDDALTTGALKGPPSGLTCPECGGALWELVDGQVVHYRCHVGHRYTADSMVSAYDDELEATIWAAMRMFQENAALHQRLANRAKAAGLATMVARHIERSQEHEARTEVLRRLLTSKPPADREAAPPRPKPPPPAP